MLKTFRQASVPTLTTLHVRIPLQIVSSFQVRMLWSKKSDPAGYRDSTLSYLMMQL